MKIIDARKMNCPQPVILTKKQIDAGENQITIIVDNETAKSNVIKFASKFNYHHSEKEKSDGIYIIIENDGANKTREEKIQNKSNKNGILISQEFLGSGSDELGKILMRGFIYTVTQTKPYPKFIVFLNGGVKITSEGSESIDDLKILQELGVEIVSCGTCLDYFNLKEKLLVGEISNMYDIVELLNNSENVISM